ncbi:hypothetical protein GCM10007079_32020 [Nocardiopsis terrae]|nr:hypothetical protein GCM10007079_32020 [Nocardiopsis terrae]
MPFLGERPKPTLPGLLRNLASRAETGHQTAIRGRGGYGAPGQRAPPGGPPPGAGPGSPSVPRRPGQDGRPGKAVSTGSRTAVRAGALPDWRKDGKTTASETRAG